MLKKSALIVLIAFAVLFASAFVSTELTTILLLLYLLVAICALIYFIIKGIKWLFKKATKGNKEAEAKAVAPQAEQHAQQDSATVQATASVQKHITVQVTPPHIYAQQAKQQETAPEKAEHAHASYCEGYPLRYHYEHVGVYVMNPQALSVANVCVGDELEVWQEKGNLYDRTAVALRKNQTIVAYLYKNNRLYGMANDWLDADLPVLSKVARTSTASEGTMHVSLDFYGSPREVVQGRKAFKLTRTANATAQEEIALCNEGDKLDIERDDEGNYIVTNCGDKVGHLPVSAVKVVDEYGGEYCCHAIVAEKGLTDSLKETISVYIIGGQ